MRGHVGTQIDSTIDRQCAYQMLTLEMRGVSRNHHMRENFIGFRQVVSDLSITEEALKQVFRKFGLLLTFLDQHLQLSNVWLAQPFPAHSWHPE
jgi:hypothetical protein